MVFEIKVDTDTTCTVDDNNLMGCTESPSSLVVEDRLTRMLVIQQVLRYLRQYNHTKFTVKPV